MRVVSFQFSAGSQTSWTVDEESLLAALSNSSGALSNGCLLSWDVNDTLGNWDSPSAKSISRNVIAGLPSGFHFIGNLAIPFEKDRTLFVTSLGASTVSIYLLPVI
jgi:hypothetical protein